MKFSFDVNNFHVMAKMYANIGQIRSDGLALANVTENGDNHFAGRGFLKLFRYVNAGSNVSHKPNPRPDETNFFHSEKMGSCNP